MKQMISIHLFEAFYSTYPDAWSDYLARSHVEDWVRWVSSRKISKCPRGSGVVLG